MLKKKVVCSSEVKAFVDPKYVESKSSNWLGNGYVFDPLYYFYNTRKIMCSQKWAKPGISESSLNDPTPTDKEAAEDEESGSEIIRTSRLLESLIKRYCLLSENGFIISVLNNKYSFLIQLSQL